MKWKRFIYKVFFSRKISGKMHIRKDIQSYKLTRVSCRSQVMDNGSWVGNVFLFLWYATRFCIYVSTTNNHYNSEFARRSICITISVPLIMMIVNVVVTMLRNCSAKSLPRANSRLLWYQFVFIVCGVALIWLKRKSSVKTVWIVASLVALLCKNA